LNKRLAQIVTVAALAAFLLPAGALGSPGHGHGKAKKDGQGETHGHKGKDDPKGHKGKGDAHKAWVFRGTYNADGTVRVTSGNSRVRRANPALVGTDVAFDYSAARFSVADTNNDSAENKDDLQPGDRVVVKARRNADGTFKARKVVDRTHPKQDENEQPEPTKAG